MPLKPILDLRPGPRTVTSRSSSVLLFLGLSSLLMLILLIGGVSLSEMHSTQVKLRSLLDNQVHKLELIARMRHFARERTIALQRMLLLDDPFEQDEIFQHFNILGSRFVVARQNYLDLGLSEQEQEVLDRQGKLSGEVVPVQRRIGEMIREGNGEAAHELLVNEAFPGQDRVFEELENLYSMQKEDLENRERLQLEDFASTRRLIYGFLGGILVLGLLVASATYVVIRRAEKVLYATSEHLFVILQSIGEAVISTDLEGRLVYVNPQAEMLLGGTRQALVGQSLQQILSLNQAGQPLDMEQLFRQVLHTDERMIGFHGLTFERECERKLVELTAAPVHGADGMTLGSVLALRDVTSLRELDEELTYRASHDSLTGLLNRHAFELRIQAALEQSRMEGVEHILCYMDLDMFKAVNDTCGHSAGDELLRQLGTHLSESLRRQDALARLGGDEFGLLLLDTDLETGRRIGEKMLAQVKQFRFAWEKQTFQVGISIGLAPVRRDSGTLSHVMQLADFACYNAKEAGRNRVVIARDDMASFRQRRGQAEWVSRINEALEQDRFIVHCQPIIPLQGTSHPSWYGEVLVRLIDEDGLEISPMAFIPAAERYHLMPKIDRVVIGKTVQVLWDAQQKGILTSGHNISVNLSGQSFTDRGLLDFIMDQIDQYEIDPERLCFEVTETTAIANLNAAIRFMHTLRGIGCRFSLDDFGSGLSSFAYLKNLPINTVKIDGLFVRDVVKDETYRIMVRSIADMARSMGIATVAEFVENSEVDEALRALGVDFGQGYFYGGALPLTAESLASHTR